MASAQGVVRAAEALLRTFGETVLLRVPCPPGGVDDAAEMGLETPAFQDVELGPGVFRKAGSASTLLIAAAGVQALAGTLAAGSAEALFESAAGVVVAGQMFVVEGVTAERSAGEAFCFVMKLRDAAAV